MAIIVDKSGFPASSLIAGEPAMAFFNRSRLNVIAGDNGLGKSFLLECAWWALSGQWADLQGETAIIDGYAMAWFETGSSGKLRPAATRSIA